LAFIDVTQSDVMARNIVERFLRTWKRTRNVELAEKEATTPRPHSELSERR
jgi:hypothetical protein